MYCRESNPVRVLSQKNRALNLARKAVRGYRENPNVGTVERRRDRLLAFVSLRAKARYIVACCKGASFDEAHAHGQAYQKAYKGWKGYYDTNIAL